MTAHELVDAAEVFDAREVVDFKRIRRRETAEVGEQLLVQAMVPAVQPAVRVGDDLRIVRRDDARSELDSELADGVRRRISK